MVQHPRRRTTTTTMYDFDTPDIFAALADADVAQMFLEWARGRDPHEVQTLMAAQTGGKRSTMIACINTWIDQEADPTL